MYTVKEIFYTLQGEGRQSGRAAVFCRFSGCNLWSGQERHRAQAICRFCDTEFVGTGPDGGKFADSDQLADRIAATWPQSTGGIPYVVCTGGEPLLQLDSALISALHARGFEVAVETNGTLAAPAGLDWICVSPKAGAPLVQTSGHAGFGAPKSIPGIPPVEPDSRALAPHRRAHHPSLLLGTNRLLSN